MIETINIIKDHVDALSSLGASVLGLLPILISICSAITALFPPPKESSKLFTIYQAVNYLAINVRHAKNANDSNS